MSTDIGGQKHAMNAVHAARSGLIAGTAGTAALNIVTYLDMLVRGRPASSMPATLVKHVAQAAGVDALASDDETTQHRREAVGSLLGYANGLGVGVVYGCIRPLVRGWIPLPLAAIVVGAAAMALSDIPAARAKATDPSSWAPADWLADALPHLTFGVVVAQTFERIDRAAET